MLFDFNGIMRSQNDADKVFNNLMYIWKNIHKTFDITQEKKYIYGLALQDSS